MPLLQNGRPKYLKTPIRRSIVGVVLAATSWAHLLYAQQGGTTSGTAGGASAPAAPLAPAAAEEKAPVRPALPSVGNAPKTTEQGTTAEGVLPGLGTLPKASPFALPTSTPEEKKERSFFNRQGTGASSLFGTPQDTTGQPETTGTTSESGGPRVLDAPTTFSTSGFYGSGGVSLTTGSGRLAKPREKWSFTAGMGFDDNTQQAPTDGGGTDDVVFRQVIPAQPEISQTVSRQVFSGYRPGQINGSFIPTFRTETQKVIIRPFQPEREFVQTFPGIPDRLRESSVITSLDAAYQAQWAKGKKAFTMDARAGVDYYWNRATDPLEYEGSLSLLYIRRVSSRLQLSTALSGSHSTQPDYNRINAAADSSGSVASSLASSKTDISYRWSRHFSTVTSLTADVRFQEQAQGSGASGLGSFMSYGIGNEFRYLWSPRLTYVTELRHSTTKYLDSDNGNATISLLAGADWDLTRRLRVTTRLGEAIRTFQPSGTESSSPYGELSLAYQPTRRDSYTFSSRYGFEESSLPGAQQLVFRNSLNFQHLFSPKLTAGAAITRVTYETKAVGSSGAGSSQEVVDGSLNLRYFYSRKVKLGASYSYSNSSTSLGLTDYYKNRVFFTGEYEF